MNNKPNADYFSEQSFLDLLGQDGAQFLTYESLQHIASNPESIDVLHIVGSEHASWPPERWFLNKTGRWCQRLNSLGYIARAVLQSVIPPALNNEVFFELVHLIRPRVIVSRAFSLSSNQLAWLALRMPDTHCIQVNHTPASFHVWPKSRGPVQSLQAIKCSKDLDNFSYALVSERDYCYARSLFPDAKILHIPNPCRRYIDPDLSSGAKCHPTGSIALAGRVNFQKNFRTQLDAVALLARSCPVQLHLLLAREQIQGMREEITSYARALAAEARFQIRIFSFLPPQNFLDYLASKIDILLHVSFDESFGYLPWEAMDAGIPVIGGPASGPATVRADPTSVSDIKHKIEGVFADLKALRESSHNVAETILQKNNSGFDKQFAVLLGEPVSEGVGPIARPGRARF